MSDAAINLLDAARAYRQRGWLPIPIPPRQKGPRLKGWQNLRIAEADLPLHFNCVGNVGLLLGEPSGWLIDVDLDCFEARELADEFLPPTPAVTGRPSAPASHRWYIADGAVSVRHRDPTDKSTIVELRSTGLQTVVGPSIHPSGEPYDSLMGEPARVDAGQLAASVAALAGAVVRRRHGDLANRGERGPTSPPTARTRGPVPSADALERRAAAYLDAMSPAISGLGGHNATYAAATALVHGFALDRETAFRMLCGGYNPRCQPPWTENELRHKVEDAATKPHDKPYGWLRDATTAGDMIEVDLSSFAPLQGNHPGDDENERRIERPPDPGPFPERLLNVPGFIDDVIAFNLATATRTQPVLALAAAICLQAVLAARKVRDERGNRTNLYCVGIAPSGAGKDHARKVNKNVLFQSGLNEHEGNEDLASDAGLVTAVENEPAILFQIDEFGRFLRTIGDPKKAPHLFNVLTALMKLYSSADTVFRGKAYADRKRNKVIDQPCVSVYGTTVPEHFFESLTADSLSDGFIARLLVFEAATTPSRQRTTAGAVPEPIVEAARWWGDFKPGGNLRTEHPQPVIVPCTTDAGQIFDDLAATVDSEISKLEATGSEGRSLWARAEEKACRLALVHACSANRQTPVIDGCAARWACDLSVYLTRRMIFIAHEWVADGLFDARQKRVLRIIRDAPGGRVSRTQLCFKTRWLSQRERQEVMDNLKETGQIAERMTSKPGAGRPKVEYEATN
jgi:hypothetical protein